MKQYQKYILLEMLRQIELICEYKTESIIGLVNKIFRKRKDEKDYE